MSVNVVSHMHLLFLTSHHSRSPMSTHFPDNYFSHEHLHRRDTTNPLVVCDFDDHEFPSGIDVVERDIDAEIEARQKQSCVAARVVPPPMPHAPHTTSQRMLQSLQQRHAMNRAAAVMSPCRCTPIAAERNEGNSMVDMNTVVNKKTPLASTVAMPNSAYNKPLLSRSRSSCTDRLEARISKKHLARRDNCPEHSAADEEQDLSLLYSERETYPFMSVRKKECATLSYTPLNNAFAPQEIRMMEIMDKERAMRALQQQKSCLNMSSNAEKDHRVTFHFRRGLSTEHDVSGGRTKRLALTHDRADASGVNALVTAQPLKRVTDPVYTNLTSQLTRTESRVDSIESCMKKPLFSRVAPRVLKELQLLIKTTQQVRTDGATLILANIGKPQNTDITQPLQSLVARAGLAQKRIGSLMDAVKEICEKGEC